MGSNFYVYQLRRDDSIHPFYVGKGMNNRMYQHFDEYQKNKKDEHTIVNPLKFEIFKNADQNNVKILVEVLHLNLNEHEAFEIEKQTIKSYGRIIEGGCLSNLTLGGDGGNTLIDPIAKQKWQKAMLEVNSRPEVKIKRSNSAKNMWKDPEKRKKIHESQLKSFDDKRINQFRYVNWTKTKDKWIKAEEIYSIWVLNGKMKYKKFSNYLVSIGYPQFNMQKMLKYFETKDPRIDPVYQSWKNNIKN